MLIREALAQGSADLKFAGIKTPNLDASLLLAHVLKINREKLVAAGNEKIPQNACAQFCDLIERRCYGECVAYITGKKEFWGLEFTVSPFVLVPRPETETLVEAVLELMSHTDKEKISVLDLCTGSGAVAVSLKKEKPELEVYASDISKEALEVAMQNAKKHSGNDSIHFFQVQFFHGDLYDALPSSAGPFNFIVSNPPYVTAGEIETLSPEVQNEPRLALDGGESGLEIIKRIIEKAPEHLVNGGCLAMEADPRQMEEIKLILEKRGFRDIKLYKDLSQKSRVISGRYEQ